MRTPPLVASVMFRLRFWRLASFSICCHWGGSNALFMVSCNRSSRSVISPNKAARAGSFCRSNTVTRPSIRVLETTRRYGCVSACRAKSRMLASPPMSKGSDRGSSTSFTFPVRPGLVFNTLTISKLILSLSYGNVVVVCFSGLANHVLDAVNLRCMS